MALLLLASTVLAPSAMASGIFAGMDGKWRGDGSIEWYDGTSESIRCTSENKVADDGHKLNQVLKCATQSGGLNFITDLTYRPAAGVVIGTWRETGIGWGGNLSGRATAREIDAQVNVASSKNISARVSVITGGGQQVMIMRINSPEGLTEISAKMRR